MRKFTNSILFSLLCIQFNLKKTMIMKKFTTSLLFSLLCFQLLSAQNWDDRTHNQSDWVLGIGINGVYDAKSNDFFSINEKWNLGNPIYVSAEYFLNNKFSVASILSFNKYKEGKIIDKQTILKNHEASYVAFDLAGKYSFRDLLNSNAFEPYVLLGAGYTHIAEYKTEGNDQIIPAKGRMTLNAGIGLNYWLSEDWGLNINGIGKFGLRNGVTNQLQASLGVLFKIPEKL